MNPCLILFPFSFYVFHVFSCLCSYSSYCFIASCICSLLVLNEVYLNLNLSLKRKCRVKSTGGSRWGEEGLRGDTLYLEIISIGGCVCHSVVKSETYIPANHSDFGKIFTEMFVLIQLTPFRLNLNFCQFLYIIVLVSNGWYNNCW